MMIKMVAMGGWGKGTYLADSWNRLDFFIVMSGALEYCLQVDNLNLTAIRTITSFTTAARDQSNTE